MFANGKYETSYIEQNKTFLYKSPGKLRTNRNMIFLIVQYWIEQK